MQGKKLNIVVPIVIKDMDSFNLVYKYWQEYLPMKKVILIGPNNLEKYIKQNNIEFVEFIDEDDIIPYSVIRDIIANITNDKDALERTGWYLQQFIKMAYARICEEDYYLIWDADTVPLRKMEMFIDGTPCFDLKTEYHEPYFETIGRLFPGFKKAIDGSFISEHMLIDKRIMCEMLDEIEKNENIEGTLWYEKILNAISVENIGGSGFSEFETFGTYVMFRYPDRYQNREWTSCRNAYRYFYIKKFRKKDAVWLAKEYDAASFEKSQGTYRYRFLFHLRLVHKLFSYNEFLKWIRKYF